MAGIKGMPSPKPQSTPSPNLNQAAEDEFESALNQVDAHPPQIQVAANQGGPMPTGAPAPSGPADPFDSALAQGGEGGEGVSDSNGGVWEGIKSGVGGVARGLDYAGGLTRTGLASVASVAKHAMNGELKDDVTQEDVLKALKGKAPSSSEYYQRLGVPELGSIDIPLIGKVSGRGAIGFATDILTDPLTSINKLAKEYPAIKNLISNPIGRAVTNGPDMATQALGEAVHSSAVSKIDQKITRRVGEGATPVADALLHGVENPMGGAKIVEGAAPVGGTDKLAQRVNDVSNVMGKFRNGLYQKSQAAGAVVDLTRPMERSEAFIANLKGDPGTEHVADLMQELLDSYKGKGKVDIPTLSAWKTNLYNAIPKRGWTDPSLMPLVKQFKAALATDFKHAIIDSGNSAQKGLGDAINAINERWAPLLNAKDPLAKQAQREVIDLGGDAIDHAIIGLGHVKGAAVKKALDIASSSRGRTFIGRALMEAGKSSVANRLFINSQQGDGGEQP